MSVRPIVIAGDPVLHRPAQPVQTFDGELLSLIADMKETNKAAHGVGLAAPQIGVGLRIFVYALENDDGVPEEGVIINPVVTLGGVLEEKPDPETESEGCLSFPGEHYPLKRADSVQVSAVDEHGAPMSFEANGWFARCMQHEYDHIEGTLYVDRLLPEYRRQARRVLRENGWGVPQRSWLPGVDPDPFGH